MAERDRFRTRDLPLHSLPDAWREKAAELRRWAADGQAQALDICAADLEAALQLGADELLTFEQGAEESGYSVDHLRRLVASGKLRNSGRRGGPPRIRRGDLPKRPKP